MLEKLKEEVCAANLELVKRGLVISTWGNVSGRDPETGLIVIKPSGVAYSEMLPRDLPVVAPDTLSRARCVRRRTRRLTSRFIPRSPGSAG